jgi:sulfonate transport system ATP-binding protein
MHRLIEALGERHNPAVLLITHDVDEALLLADRALVLDKGRITAVIDVDLARPRELGQPGFLGLRKRLLSAIGVHDVVRPEEIPPTRTAPTENLPSIVSALRRQLA